MAYEAAALAYAMLAERDLLGAYAEAARLLPSARRKRAALRERLRGREPRPEELRARFLWAPQPTGPAAKRNIGWRAAAAPLVAFTDDDCRAAPGWLDGLLAAWDGRDTLVQGRTEPDPDEAHLNWGLARSQRIDRPSEWFESCNLAYPRALLERLGGFDDESFTFGGEDTDLGRRALAAGARRAYAPDAVVWHAVHSRHLRAVLRDARAWRDLPLVVRRHPDQRGALYYRLFWRDTHAKALLALAGLAIRRPAFAALALIPYWRDHARLYKCIPLGIAYAAADLPVRLLGSLIETGFTIRHALRHGVVLV
jgi:hypothetical protein